MKPASRLVICLALSLLLVTACLPAKHPSTNTPGVEPEPDLYLQLVWRLHQPFLPVDPETGLVDAPWVRLYAARDYIDLASILHSYPNVHATFNLTPSLLLQLEEFNEGARDMTWVMTETPADQLTAEQKTYLIQRFFDVDGDILARFPRYVELQQMRAGVEDGSITAAIDKWSDQDFLDLQTLFNLAWIDPDYLAQQPLLGLVNKGRDFTEEDKLAVLSIYADLVSQVIPVHGEMQDSGQSELTFTPYASPILPLLIDSDLGSIASPGIRLPRRFAYEQDAIQQLDRGIAAYEQEFGRAPRGMWPAEGAVSQSMVGMASRAGVQWMLADESILGNSLDLVLSRSQNGLPAAVTALYRPYTVTHNNVPVAIFFSDSVLSDKVSHEYSQISTQAAVDDFLTRIRAIRDELKDRTGGPYVVTVVLAGESALDGYDNNGKDFLNSLYFNLSNDPTLKTVTPSEFLSLYNQTPETIPELWAGSWDNASYETWIGEDEENRAWEYLGNTRAALESYRSGPDQGSVSEAALDRAYESILAAEASEWFWWFGSDRDSGDDSAIDTQFRETLGQVYDALRIQRPALLSVPIIQPESVEADASTQRTFTPTIDGRLSPRSEWEAAGSFVIEGDLSAIEFGFDANNLYLRGTDAALPDSLELYLQVPAIDTGSPFSSDEEVLGMYATHRIRIQFQPSAAAEVQVWNPVVNNWETDPGNTPTLMTGTGNFELSVPLAGLSQDLRYGDSILIRTISQDVLLPGSAPGRMRLPDLGQTTWVLDIADPPNDDYGPGSYTYPTDGIFKPGVFDLVNFKVGYDANYLVFQVALRGAIEDPWNSPNGLSLQAIDIYLDVDGLYSGSQVLLPGRNAAVSDRSRWDFVLSFSGWDAGLYTHSNPGTALDIPVTIRTDPGTSTIIARVPLASLPGDPTDWSYAALLFGSDTNSPDGLREITNAGGPWQFGGAPADSNHTRIIDYLWPEELEPTQEGMLSTFTPSQSDPAGLTAADFPRIEMLNVP